MRQSRADLSSGEQLLPWCFHATLITRLFTKAPSFHNKAGANYYAFVTRQALCTIFSLASLLAAAVLGCTLKSRVTSLKANPQPARSSQHSEPLQTLVSLSHVSVWTHKRGFKVSHAAIQTLREEGNPVNELFCQSHLLQKCWKGADTDTGPWSCLILFLVRKLLQWKLDF